MDISIPPVTTLEDIKQEIQFEKQLVEAASTGDLSAVIALVNQGVSVDAEEHNKALFYASQNYKTPLQMACAKGHLSCAEVLISHRADVNAKDRFDVTALHMAAEKGHSSCLKALLFANAKSSPSTKFSKRECHTAVPYLRGTTPLHLAATNNRVDCVRELMQYGADCNAVDELGRTSLYIAAQFGFGKCILAHLENTVGGEILSLPSLETGDTPLHFVVGRGMVECMKALLLSGSDANHKNRSGFSPLDLAVNPTNENAADSIEMIQSLVIDGYKTNVNKADKAGLTPLHYVCFNVGNRFRRRPEMAKFFLSYGANPDIKNASGATLLEYELKSETEDFEVLKYIVRSMGQLPSLSKLKVSVPNPPRPLLQPIERGNETHNLRPIQGMELLRLRPLLSFGLPNRGRELPNRGRGHPNRGRELNNRIREFYNRGAELAIRGPELPNRARGRPIRGREALIRRREMPLRGRELYNPDMIEDVFRPREEPLQTLQYAGSSSVKQKKQKWYDAIAENPRTLQHCCRFTIRKALGPYNVKYIGKLQIPDSMRKYLFLETGE